MIILKRIYEGYKKEDGFRILLDRLWPRGLSKEKAHLNLWLKEIAPSNSLRKWFGHDPQKWDEFQKRYLQELEEKKELVDQLKNLEKQHKTITLLYGAKDTIHNQAIVLRTLL
ncbi:MAG TPA: DUF488 family protein [Patescibacteria group bacterium]|nr:DUF488 family protein [Patescibacteria group bacterium]